MDSSIALRERIKGILLRPETEWPKIAAKPASIASIYRDYVVYLAAVPVLSTLIGSLAFGYNLSGVDLQPSLFGALWTAIVQYAVQLAGVYFLALIIDTFAPRFGGVTDLLGAFKLAAYSATASWLAGLFTIVPALSFFTILGLYSLYLLYIGAPVLLKVPAEGALGFTAAVFGFAVVFVIIVALLFEALTPNVGPSSQLELNGTASLVNSVSVDMESLRQNTLPAS